MTTDSVIEIRFTGTEISPTSVRASEIADILHHIEDMLESVVVLEHPTVAKEKVVIGLVNVAHSSIGLQFQSQVPQYVFPAFDRVARAVKNSDFRALPYGSINALVAVQTFIRRRDCVAEFIRRNGQETVLAHMSPSTEISRPQPLAGETTLYGRIIRVGGRTPRVMLETVDGQTVYCDASIALAQKLGERLYKAVGLYGLAQWDPEALTLQAFNIQEITSYEGKPVSEAIAELSSIAGKYYAEIHDVDAYVASVRGVESDE